jgi:hypothetical protein
MITERIGRQVVELVDYGLSASCASQSLRRASSVSGVGIGRYGANPSQRPEEWIYFERRPKAVDLYRRLFSRLKACAFNLWARVTND